MNKILIFLLSLSFCLTPLLVNAAPDDTSSKATKAQAQSSLVKEHKPDLFAKDNEKEDTKKQDNQALPAKSPPGNIASLNIKLPPHIPSSCVDNAARRYQVPSMALLSILRQESGGRVGIVSKNKNGSRDYGPAQLNSSSWAKYMNEKYNISLDSLTNNMCQAIMAQAYALRYEWDQCRKGGRIGGTSIWCAIRYYHSPTKKYQDRYVSGVWSQYQRILKTGSF